MSSLQGVSKTYSRKKASSSIFPNSKSNYVYTSSSSKKSNNDEEVKKKLIPVATAFAETISGVRCPHSQRVDSRATEVMRTPESWKCSQCSTTASMGVCIQCGFVGCIESEESMSSESRGKTEEEGEGSGPATAAVEEIPHLLAHFSAHPAHCIYVDLLNASVNCLECDRTDIHQQRGMVEAIKELHQLLEEAPELEGDLNRLRRAQVYDQKDREETFKHKMDSSVGKKFVELWKNKAFKGRHGQDGQAAGRGKQGKVAVEKTKEKSAAAASGKQAAAEHSSADESENGNHSDETAMTDDFDDTDDDDDSEIIINISPGKRGARTQLSASASRKRGSSVLSAIATSSGKKGRNLSDSKEAEAIDEIRTSRRRGRIDVPPIVQLPRKKVRRSKIELEDEERKKEEGEEEDEEEDMRDEKDDDEEDVVEISDEKKTKKTMKKAGAKKDEFTSPSRSRRRRDEAVMSTPPISKSSLRKLKEGEIELTRSSAKAIMRIESKKSEGGVGDNGDAEAGNKSPGGTMVTRRSAALSAAFNSPGAPASARKSKRSLKTPSTSRSGSRMLVVPGQVGIRNLGNTCYMNSVMQALSFTPAFKKHFIEFLGDESNTGKEIEVAGGHRMIRVNTVDCMQLMKSKAKSKSKSNLSKRSPLSTPLPYSLTMEEDSFCFHIHALLRVLWSGKFIVVTPFALFETIRRFVPKFKNYKQQDAQEFIVAVFDRIHEELTSEEKERKEEAEKKEEEEDEEEEKEEEEDESSSDLYDDDKTIAYSHSQENHDEDDDDDDDDEEKESPSSIITDLFQGSLLSQVTCSVCHTTSSISETFLDLSVNIPAVSVSKRRASRRASRAANRELRKLTATSSSGASAPPPSSSSSTASPATNEKAKCTLEDCFKSFTTAETLEDYQCDSCEEKQEASKRLLLHRLPSVMCIALKRFCWWDESGAKIDTNVIFPAKELDMSQFLAKNEEEESRRSESGRRRRSQTVSSSPYPSSSSSSTLYDLYSVVVHRGHQLKAGHYTCYCLDEEKSEWIHFNDSKVSIVNEEQVLSESSGAYLLFYKKRE